jgi:hypothetical protein
VAVEIDGQDSTQVVPHSGPDQYWGGYESQSDDVLGVSSPVSGGQTVSFWNWHFIEEGWDYGFVEALVGSDWVTVPVTDAAGTVVSTNENPHENNTEGNGITGTSGGEYFVDEPVYVQYSAVLSAGATDVRFRYSTDAAYLDTGWFIDDITVAGVPAVVEQGDWTVTDGLQDNSWTVQLISACDLTPGTTLTGDGQQELTDDAGNVVYRFTGDEISTPTLDTNCANGNTSDFVLSVSNLPTGDLAVLDATYDYSVVKRNQ